MSSDKKIDPLLAQLAARRESLNLTQTDVASMIHHCRSAISNIESGTSSPHFRTLRKIMDILGLDVEFVESSAESQIEYLRSLSAEELELNLLNRRWYVHPNDVIGGWCIMPIDVPPSSGCFSIAELSSESNARQIAEDHNSRLGRGRGRSVKAR